ncbi:IclR family transcriptional regulator C-terminal domain-containing protein [Nocardiopsis exhalans]|uniref:IclR family transcriptional regulator C-terminal domain-containing protein n=1 Tax=Nocardiopsis exhalans TaxID=163604 RepID=A0ABY5DI82_9ACTN|nr:IclR family transcriptional regulator C-terminal domain-containing protein [Nocardiopsis exhalans]USY22886.1 IclR family transcriptional regulator C-terminal domain-containing protein [Nocardiopsis exhalans]
MAAPRRDGQGRVFAAVNVNTHSAENSLDHLIQHHPPLLLAAAGEISADVARVESVPQVTRDL